MKTPINGFYVKHVLDGVVKTLYMPVDVTWCQASEEFYHFLLGCTYSIDREEWFVNEPEGGTYA
jgi:hypothetical protein